jgi:futalosine hydrolase
MPIKILLVTATEIEARALKKIKSLISISGGYRVGDLEIMILIAGIGSISTAWSMKEWISVNGKPDLAINVGIAGSYNDKYGIGDVVMPVSDCFADAGVEDGSEFVTLFEAGLVSSESIPFKNGIITAENGYTDRIKNILSPVRAITVNTSSGSESTIMRLKEKFNPDIETMEGATFFYICARENIPFLALRAISNRVEPRNKSNWNISLALDNLSEKLNELIIRLE